MKATTREMRIINSRLPGTSLDASQVEILPFRMFNSRMTDRYTIMSPEMMKGVLRDVNDGKVAMNALHRSSSTLPAGRSVEGRIVPGENGDEIQAKMYAVLARPDGTPMEDGKDLADRYNTGAVYACSAGIIVGKYECSICRNDIRDYKNCDHWLGQDYKVDEAGNTKKCFATMTGNDIANGVANDCGAYELSAVTAGGVRDAGILNESFSRYNGSGELAEFKKSQFDGKTIAEHIAAYPTPIFDHQEEKAMAGEAVSEKDLLAKNYELIGEKAKVDVELATIKGQYSALETVLTERDTQIGAYEIKVKEFETQLADQKTAYETQLADGLKLVDEAKKQAEEFQKTADEATGKVAGLETYKTAYVMLVTEAGVKVEAVVEDYDAKSVEELGALMTAHQDTLNKLVPGQHSLGEKAETGSVADTGLPDSCFKI